MTQNLQIFNFGNQEIRMQIINGKEYFCAKDVCDILQYSNGRDAINDNCRKDGVASGDIVDSLGRTQQATFINEPNLYRLIVKSKMPKAQEFEKWVFEEVLPSIRKTGKYEIPQKEFSKKELALMIIESEEAKERAEQKAKMLEIENIQKSEIINEQEQELELKEAIIDRYIGISKEMPPSKVGKELGLKPNKFVEKLRQMGYYITSGKQEGEPYQQFIDRGYFKVKYSEPKLIKGEMRKFPHFFITPKGFDHFFKKMQEGEFNDIKV